MTTLVIELPEQLASQLEKRQISQQDARLVALAAIEIWLSQPEDTVVAEKRNRRFEDSAIPFVHRLLTHNRELFETLAQR